MILVVLLAVAAAVAFLAPRALVNRSWVDRSPVLGVAAWYAALFSVTAALFSVTAALFSVTAALFSVTAALFSVTAALFSVTAALVIPWPRTVDALCALGSWCAGALRGEYGLLGHVAGALVVGLVLLVASRRHRSGSRHLPR